jgi:hypothetical protein
MLVSPELLASWTLRRASGGGVAKSCDQYFDDGRLTLSYLTPTFDEFTAGALLHLPRMRVLDHTPGGN